MRSIGFISNDETRIEELSRKMLRKEIEESVKQGYDTFYTCVITSADKEFMELVLEVKEANKDNDIKLEGIMPYGTQSHNVQLCSNVHYVGNKDSDSPIFLRNRELCLKCDKIIALKDQSDNIVVGQTIRYAYVIEKEVVVIQQ